jgi:hypothetical protein
MCFYIFAQHGINAALIARTRILMESLPGRSDQRALLDR